MPSKPKPSHKIQTGPAQNAKDEHIPDGLAHVYRELEHTAKIGYWEWDANNDTLISCSTGFAEIFNMTVEQVMKNIQTFEDDLKYVHPDDRDFYINSVNSFGEQSQIDVQYRIITTDGKVKYVHERGIRFINKNGKAMGAYGTLQDVTEHAIDAQNLQKAQETLEETVKQRTSELAEANKQLLAEIARHEQTENSLVLSEQRFKDFAGAASDWLYELDKDFRYTYISESHERITNIQLKKSIGKTPWEITSIPPDEEDNWEVLRQQLKRHEPVHEFEHRHISKNGNIYHGRTSAVPVFSENGEFMGYRGTVTDTTSRRRADQRLKDLHSAIDMIDERISLYDENDGIIFCNASFRKLNAATPEVLEEGVTLEEQLRAGIKKGLIPEAIGREEDWLAKRMELHRNPRGPIEVERQDGITLRIREQKLPDGKSILISSNVGHERRAKVDIEYANRTKKEFLANMSHELRTPLNAILGFSEFMLHEVSGPIGNEQYKDYINDIHESGKLLIQIISDILDISKIEARETVIEEEQNNPADIINACVRIIKGRADIADVAMKVDIQEGLPDFMADNRQIKQILLNLMSNAVKFSHSGCTVTVSAHFRDDLGIEIRVTDEGIGIAKEDLHQIMEPFHQVRSSQEHSHGGTGLGLAIAKSMINLHGGNLVLQSKLGKGTTAIISLPRERMILG